jgi:hypothetical protein
MELVQRECANTRCPLTFKVLPHDKQAYCSKDCEWNAENVKGKDRSRHFHHALVQSALPNPTMQKAIQESKVVIPRFGATERGEAPKVQPKEKLYAVKPTLDDSAIKTSISEIATKKTLNTEKKTKQEIGKTTTPTEIITLPEESNGERKTVNTATKPTESDTNESKSLSVPKSTPTDLSETQSTASTDLSNALREENQGSLKQLNDAAAHLLNIATTLAAPTKVAEDNGEVIQRAPTHNVETAIKALDGFRNVMKIKLDFLKFGKDLYDSKSS